VCSLEVEKSKENLPKHFFDKGFLGLFFHKKSTQNYTVKKLMRSIDAIFFVLAAFGIICIAGVLVGSILYGAFMALLHTTYNLLRGLKNVSSWKTEEQWILYIFIFAVLWSFIRWRKIKNYK